MQDDFNLTCFFVTTLFFRCMIYKYEMINKDILLVNENCVTFIRITNIIILSKIFYVEQSEFNSIHCANRLYNFEHTVK